ncbi:Inositol phosphatase SIW14 [Dispira simplex]|nr:Inositol phosphatase SIW14 [Dispira simplex]
MALSPPFSYNAVTDRLTQLRTTGERQPREVCTLGRWLFLEYNGFMDTSSAVFWLTAEQVLLATLDTKTWDFANKLLSMLRQKFPDSKRVDLLGGMLLEAQGQYQDATSVYQRVLQNDETNVVAQKRMVAIAKAQGRVTDAIAQMVQYVDVHSNDQDAWLELCDLYIAKSMLPQAAFAMEELLLLQPLNHIYHQKYAELHYSMQNYDIALKYFCRTLELCSDYLRALYGIKQCVAKLSALPNSPGMPSTDTLKQLEVLAVDRISAVYTKLAKDTSRVTTASNGTNSTSLTELVYDWLKQSALQ